MKLHNKLYIDISLKDALKLDFKMIPMWLDAFIFKLKNLEVNYIETYIEISYGGGENVSVSVYRGFKPFNISSKEEVQKFVDKVNEKLIKIQNKKDAEYIKWKNKNSMKRLKLNRELYEKYIKDVLHNQFYNVHRESKDGLTQFKFVSKNPNTLPATINIYENKDGTTTINPYVGKNQPSSVVIAQRLIQAGTIVNEEKIIEKKSSNILELSEKCANFAKEQVEELRRLVNEQSRSLIVWSEILPADKFNKALKSLDGISEYDIIGDTELRNIKLLYHETPHHSYFGILPEIYGHSEVDYYYETVSTDVYNDYISIKLVTNGFNDSNSVGSNAQHTYLQYSEFHIDKITNKIFHSKNNVMDLFLKRFKK